MMDHEEADRRYAESLEEHMGLNRPKLKREWTGRRVRLRASMQTPAGTLPAGAICTVEPHNGRGFQLAGPRCDCCGVQLRAAGVPEDAVELVEEEPQS